MSSGVYKFGVGYSFKDEDKRVIDSNALVADRLEQLSAKMQQRVYEEPAFGEEFAAGLDAVEVEKLLEDSEEDPEEFNQGLFGTPLDESQEGENAGNVIKAPRINPAEIEEQRQQLLADASAQAEEIINAANNEASAIRNEAYEQGRNEGYQDGIDRANEEYEVKFAQIDEKIRELNAEYEAKLEELEPLFIETLTDIYEHVIHVDLSGEKSVIYHLIKDAIRKVDGSNDFIIHVSKDDYGFVSMQKRELLSGLSSADTAEIVEDATLRQGECFIETGGGIFDCSLETQLQGLKKELRLLSYAKDNI